MTEPQSVSRRLWKALWSEPLQTLGGFLMTVVGIALTFSDGWEKAVGGILVAAGGVLVTSSTSVAYSRDTALDEVKKRLVALNQTIATACGHIESAAEGLDEGSIDQETLCTVIEHSLHYLTAAGSQIQDIVGQKLDSGALAQTARDFKHIQSALVSAHDQAVQSGAQETAQAILNAQSQLEVFADRLSALAEAEDIVVACPYCGAPHEVTLGKASGSSLMPTCPNCGQQFHAHRKADGSVLVRAHGKKSREVVTTIVCPQCGDVHKMRTGNDETEPQQRWCLVCFSRQTVDPLQGCVTESSPDVPLTAAIVGADGSNHTLVVCPECGGTVRTFARRGFEVYGVCYQCDRLLTASLRDIEQPASTLADSEHTIASGHSDESG